MAASDEATRTLALGNGHVHPDDVDYAIQVDRFDVAMEIQRAIGHADLELKRA